MTQTKNQSSDITYKVTCKVKKQRVYYHLFNMIYIYLERLLVDQAVHQDEALSIFYVQVSHGGKLLSACCVEDFQHRWRGIHLNLFPIKVLDGGVIFFNECAGDKLDSQSGFADPAASQHHNFVLFHLADRDRLT